MGLRVSDVLNKHIKEAKAKADKVLNDAMTGPITGRVDDKWQKALAQYSVHYAGLLLLRRLKRDLKKNLLIR